MLNWLPPLALFIISAAVLLRTLVPTIYTLDSAEFVTGARLLGIVHAPGYALYLLALHLFLRLPGDPGFLGNLFSALCLALTAPLLYGILRALVADRWIAAVGTLILLWSYAVWLVGLFAEVYAPQLLTLTLTGWALVSRKPPLATGALFGLAVAANPASILAAPGMAAAFRAQAIPWRKSIAAALVGACLFGLTLLYFPWRYTQQPPLNLAGTYDSRGVFHAVDLTTPGGILWLLSGRQFGGLFFQGGQPVDVALLFARSFLGFGVVIGLFGAYALYRQRRGLLAAWLAFFVPYTGFYATYGAGDRLVMFGPSLLLWSILIAFGLRWMVERLPAVRPALVALPLLLLVAHFPLLDLSGETSVRTRAEATLARVDEGAAVFGQWHDVVPLEYLHFVEGWRPDVTIYNRFLFAEVDLRDFVSYLVESGRGVVFVHTLLEGTPADGWLFAGYEVEIVPVPDETALYLYVVRGAR